MVRHLPTCASCRALVREAEETAADLGSAVDQVTPPVGLRDRILDAAERTPRSAPPRPVAGSPVEHEPAADGTDHAFLTPPGQAGEVADAISVEHGGSAPSAVVARGQVRP